MSDPDVENILPPTEIGQDKLDIVFTYFIRRLARFRNASRVYSATEYHLSGLPEHVKAARRDEYNDELAKWAQDLLDKAYVWIGDPKGECPKLTPYADTATRNLPELPADEYLKRILNGILILHITHSKEYSARTKAFLGSFGPFDESAVVTTLKNPKQALEAVQKKADATKASHNDKNKKWRVAGMVAAGIGGGVLVGVTGGLAAPLLGGAVSTIFGIVGLGGTAASLLASGLAGSGVVCGALFGAYGARSTASMVERHTKEISDLSIIPVRQFHNDESLAVRLCVSGWLTSQEDVWEPWTIFRGDDTFALQWEVTALTELSTALYTLMTSKALSYMRAEILARTVLSTVMSALTPIALLNVGQIIDNPWMNARALAIKTGRVLGDLLAQRAFGNRPVSLCGFSLGALVIFEALQYLATLPPSQTFHLIHDVHLFGTPTSNAAAKWANVRRVVSGRLVNGYSSQDYVLAVLSRASSASWEQAGLSPVDVRGVENVLCERVVGHLQWRGMVGECLRADVKVMDGTLDDEEVDDQLRSVAKKIVEDLPPVEHLTVHEEDEDSDGEIEIWMDDKRDELNARGEQSAEVGGEFGIAGENKTHQQHKTEAQEKLSLDFGDGVRHPQDEQSSVRNDDGPRLQPSQPQPQPGTPTLTHGENTGPPQNNNHFLDSELEEMHPQPAKVSYPTYTRHKSKGAGVTQPSQRQAPPSSGTAEYHPLM